MRGCHSTIESPDSVSLVTPPTTTMANTRAQQANNQMATDLCMVGLDEGITKRINKRITEPITRPITKLKQDNFLKVGDGLFSSHQPLLIAYPFFLFFGLALVMLLLTSGQAYLKFDFAGFIMHIQGNQRVSGALHLTDQAFDFLCM